MNIERPTEPTGTTESGDSKFSEFIKKRNILPEDIHLLEELAQFPKSIVVQELHNLFNMYKEQSLPELTKLGLAIPEGDSRKRLYAIFLDLGGRYDWMVLYNLVRVLEK